MAAWKQVILLTLFLSIHIQPGPSRTGLFTVRPGQPRLTRFISTTCLAAHYPHICQPRIIPAWLHWDLLAATRVRTRTAQVTLLISMVIPLSRQLSEIGRAHV